MLLRVLLRDDPVQSKIADELFEAAQIFIGLGVLLETEWTLRRRSGWTRPELNTVLAGLLDAESIVVEAPALVAWALLRHAEGADFADMLHLVNARSADEFATFDRAVERFAGSNSPVVVRTLN